MTWISLDVSDGTAMRAFVARPTGSARHPGLLVLQEAFGVNSHIRDVATRFAAQGYVAIAPELFHRTGPGFEGAYDNFDPVRQHMAALTDDGQIADLAAAHAWLVNDASVDPRHTAAVGYCMGGRSAFLANATLPLAAAASYYGGNIPSVLDRTANLSGPHLFCWGGLDKHVAADQRHAVMAALDAAGKPYVHVKFSGADHGFFCDQKPQYHKDSALEAWALTLAFFERGFAARS
ncbi:MAG TPA: dienelactone hydrolase family protein [Gemmatimonadales bacterium]|nr:dienelactone hydrolase family protein [Gemmatimonadales bacterium]